ncbi:MAG: Ig-like domain-containing protein [Pirellulales bacterium]
MPTRFLSATQSLDRVREFQRADKRQKQKRRQRARLSLESLEPRQMLANAPVGYWAFDNAANVGKDSGPNNSALTAVGNAAYTASGHTGGALALDGTGDYLESAAFPAGVPTGNGAYTISAWIKPAAGSTLTTRGGIVGWGTYGVTRQVNALRLRGANGLRNLWFNAELDASDAQVTAAGIDLDGGEWRHVVATYDGATRSIWIDGQPIVSDMPGVNDAQATNFRIGRTNASPAEDFNGLLDDIAIWDNSLAPNQIAALATGASPLNLPVSSQGLVAHWVADDLNALLDDGDLPSAWSDNVGGRPAEPTGFPTLEKNELNGHSVIRFTPSDGDDQLRVLAVNSPLANAANYTVAVVFRADEPGTGGATDWFANTGIVDASQPGVNNDWGLALNGAGQVAAGVGNPDRTVYSSSLFNAGDGQPHVAVMTRDGSSLSIAIDGLSPITRTDTGGALRGAFDMAFGSLATNANYFAGDIAEVRVYNTALAPGDAGSVAQSLIQTYGIATPTSPLAIAGELLVDLRATDPTAATGTWSNLGTLGDFTRIGNPDVQTINGVTAVALNFDHPTGGWDDAYQGPIAPASITANGTRSIEVWAYNPNDGLQQQEETAVAWGHRGGPAGANLTFGYGNSGTWGAVGHWGAPDMPWYAAGGSPTLGQWHHLVYTYDGGTVRLYSDGVETYTEAVGALGTYANTTINLGAQNGGGGALSLVEGQAGSLALANVRVHTGILSPAGILTNYQLGVLTSSTPPVSNADAYAVDEDESLVVAAPGVLTNDSNPSGLTFAAVLDVGPAGGSVSLATDGSFSYDPNPNFNGVDTFTYHAVSGGTPSAQATVTITVNPQYDPAVAVDDNYLTATGQGFVTPVSSGVLANDLNPDGLSLAAQLVDGVDHGTLSLTSIGVFSYTPTAGFVGVDSFQYRVFDTVGTSNTATVTITVDTPPTADDDAYALDEDVALVVPAASGVLVGDSDAENDSLTAVVVTPPAHGALVLAADGSFTYTPMANFFGTDSFTYRASDGDQQSAVATVSLTINPINDAPTASDDIYFGFQDAPIVATTQNGVLINDTDVDGPALSAILVTNVAHGTLALAANGTFTYTPATGYIGTDSFTYKLSDSLLESDPATVLLIVNSPDAQIVINELHYEPVFNNIPEEFIELYNNGPTAVDLTGWYFSDGVDYVFPNGAAIQPGEYLVVAEDPATIQFLYGVAAYGPWSGSLNNEGEEITLRNAQGNRIDRVDYNLGFPWPTSVAGDGPSMELINPNLDNDLGGSWRASSVGTEPRPAVTLLAEKNTNWSYRKGTSEASNPTTAWRQPGFALDGTWETGQTPIGYGDNDDSTPLLDMQNSYSSVYLRNTFTVASAADMPEMLRLRVYSDDGAIVWINGVEVARLRLPGGEIPYNATSGDHEASWDVIDINNPTAFLNLGTNTIAVHGFNTTLGSSDFSIDAEVIDPGTEGLIGVPTPGEQNSVFANNAAPQIRQVNHAVDTPAAGQTNVVTAKVTDPNGVASVTLHYQIVAPGAYIPATIPTPVSQLIAGNVPSSRVPNPAYENAANWTSVAMVDDGAGGDAVAGDNIYSATVPGQVNRTLVRYRITVADTVGASQRVPYADDPSLNFAYYVYDGVPDYQGVSGQTLATLPVYTIISRSQDIYDAIGHDPAVQLPQFIGSGANPARFYENWEAAFVYDGKVYDHVHYRLGGANGRYQLNTKRNWRIRFNRGNFLEARDQDGDLYPERWRTLTVGKGMSNRLTLTYGLNEAVNYYLWNTLGVPAPETHFFHMRVVDGANEAPDAWQGDFWGLQWAQETYDVRFLESHNLEKGNLYKLINSSTNSAEQQRYQAADAVRDGSDLTNVENNVRSSQTTEWLEAHVNYDEWIHYHALAQAIRHYDYWPSANKNAAWYFAPPYTDENSDLGQMWTLPWDTDATWGPTYNCGEDRPFDAIFATGSAPSCLGVLNQENAELAREYRNVVRELRDLLWQQDQISGIVNSFASDIAAFVPADRIRWNTVPSNLQNPTVSNVVGSYSGIGNNFDLAGYVQDMLNFAFTGGNWPGGGVGTGGQAAWLDQLQASGGDGALIPVTPTISYIGQPSFPVDGLALQTSPFADPQGSNTFAAMQWRIGEITDPSAPAYDPAARFKLEWDAAWESGTLATFDNAVSVPAGFVDTGHTYRARVRMMDTTGVWSHWSAPLTFTATGPANTQELLDHLRVSEIMYNPPPATTEERALGFSDQDFEFLEFTNTGNQILNLSQVRIVDGVTFHFTGAPITSIAPAGYLLLVRNQAGFEARYGTGHPVAGVFEDDTALANGGERLKIEDIGNTLIQEFTYDDTGETWHPSTDGEGYSLVIVDVGGPLESWNNGIAWRPSHEWGGSPGAKDLIRGDVDENNRVDLADLAMLQGHFGLASGASRADGDLDGDGDVDRADVAILARNFARSYLPPVSPSAPAAIRAVAVQREADGASRLAARQASLAVSRRSMGRTALHVDLAVHEMSLESSLAIETRSRSSLASRSKTRTTHAPALR